MSDGIKNGTFEELLRPIRVSHNIGAGCNFPIIEAIKKSNLGAVVDIVFKSSENDV